MGSPPRFPQPVAVLNSPPPSIGRWQGIPGFPGGSRRSIPRLRIRRARILSQRWRRSSARGAAPPGVAAPRRNAWRKVSGRRHAGAPTPNVGHFRLAFINRNRVPFQYRGIVQAKLKARPFVQSSSGVTLTDWTATAYDLAGSYGVNVFGYDFYKGASSAARARARTRPGARRLSPGDRRQRRAAAARSPGLDEVSFHMSGTEAVMQAVRLARYHTGRTHLVRFCGAYHGWWEDVQPGIGNPCPRRDTYTLKDMDERPCACCARARTSPACWSTRCRRCIRTRARRRPHARRQRPRAHFDRPAYPRGCEQLREVCTRARHRADLRRGVRRLPARLRRRAGVFRRAGRHGDLRQDAGRRPAGRRGVRRASI